MDWLDHHRLAERLMFQAGETRRAGERQQASKLLLQAAEAETNALGTLSARQVRTWDITTVSIASLYFQAGELDVAERKAAEYLLDDRTTSPARERLRNLLTLIWSEQRRQDSELQDPADSLMVALDDGDLDTLGITLTRLAKSTKHMKTGLVQTAALRLALPFSAQRRIGQGQHDICNISVDEIDPYAQEYSLIVREPRLYQLELPEPQAESTTLISQNFFDLINAAVEASDDLLLDIVPSQQYRRSLVAAFRELAPTGRDTEFTHIHSPDDSLGIELDPSARQQLTNVLDALRQNDAIQESAQTALRGELVGLDLPAGSIKLRTRNQGTHTIIVGKTIVAQYLEQLADREIELFVRSDQGRLLFEGINITATERTISNGT